eukprot:3941124-Rhodomonas_salina.3
MSRRTSMFRRCLRNFRGLLGLTSKHLGADRETFGGWPRNVWQFLRRAGPGRDEPPRHHLPPGQSPIPYPQLCAARCIPYPKLSTARCIPCKHLSAARRVPYRQLCTARLAPYKHLHCERRARLGRADPPWHDPGQPSLSPFLPPSLSLSLLLLSLSLPPSFTIPSCLSSPSPRPLIREACSDVGYDAVCGTECRYAATGTRCAVLRHAVLLRGTRRAVLTVLCCYQDIETEMNDYHRYRLPSYALYPIILRIDGYLSMGCAGMSGTETGYPLDERD